MLHQVQAVGVVVTTSSVELWSLSWLYEWARVGPKSPLPGSRIDHQGSCCCILGEAHAQARMIEMKGRKISQDRGGYSWCLIPQWYECMLMHIGIPSWCSIRCLFIWVWLWVVVVATLPWLELAWYIWVTNRWYEYGAKFRWTQHCSPWKQELTPSCDLEVYMKQFICIWIPTKRAGLWTHMVYLNCCNHLWVLRLELNNMYENEWKDPDLLASNRDSFWCDSIICYDAEW
jgi:hypothetical protein